MCLIFLIPCQALLLSIVWSLQCLASKLPRTELVRSTPNMSSAFQTGLVWSVPNLSGTQQFCFQTLVNFFTSCPFHVLNLYSISLVLGWTLVVRKGPRAGKMWPGPPSGVAQARRLCLVGLLLLAHVTTPLGLVMRGKMTVRCLRGMHLLSGPTTWPSNTPRMQSRVQSMGIVKPLCMKAANSPVILAFGHVSTSTGTVLSISTRRGQ
jgi:hypothetical protein